MIGIFGGRKVAGFAILFAIDLLVVSHPARAIGPSYQYVNDSGPNGVNGAPIGTLNDAAAIGADVGGLFTQVGTGSVIGVSENNNTVDLAILTANHVADTPGATIVEFGAGPEALLPNGNSQEYLLSANVVAFQTYTLNDPIGNPDLLPEDLSVELAAIDTTNLTAAEQAELTLIVNNPFSLAEDMDDIDLTGPIDFTEIGYGRPGVFDCTAYGLGAKQAGARRFQNNTVDESYAPAVETYNEMQKYYEPIVQYTSAAPSLDGTGTGLRGDSGGAFLTGGESTDVEVNVTSECQGGGAVPEGLNDIPLDFSDDISAIAVAGTLTGGESVPGLNYGYGVPLVSGPNGSLDWAEQYALNPGLIDVPEPPSLALLGSSLAAIAMTRRRRRG
jgi:hypothetical protein